MTLANNSQTKIEHLLLIVVFILLTSCGQSQETDFHADATDSETGIQVEYDGLQYPISDISKNYKAVEACMGMGAYPGPHIIIYDELDSYYGYTFFDTPLIIVSSDVFTTDKINILRHEMVHYILLKNGYPDSLNSNHESVLFDLCGNTMY